MVKNRKKIPGGQIPMAATSPGPNISSGRPSAGAKPRERSRHLRRSERQNTGPVQLSLDLEAVTGPSVVESPESVVESPNSETVQQKLSESVTLQQSADTLQQPAETLQQPPLPGHLPALRDPVVESVYPNGIPQEQSPAAKTDKHLEENRNLRRAKGWLVWRIQYLDCSGKQRSRVVKLGQPIPENSYGPYAHYCWYRPGTRNGEKYLGKPESLNYKKFLAAWDECSRVDEIIGRVFGPTE